MVDYTLRAREERRSPMRVGIIGAGFMARGLRDQIVIGVPGTAVE